MLSRGRIFLGILCSLALLALPVQAQKRLEDPQTHCDPFYGTDIGPSILALPDGTWQTVSSDCTATAGCDEYFDFQCAGGEVVSFTFCSQGGSASWDTGISTFSGAGFPTIEDCNDDTCDLQSELDWNVPDGAVYRMRVGGFGGASGSYTLAYNLPATCTILGALPVELEWVEVEKK